MGLSIKDIARKAMVSVTTVSRVINHSPLVDEKTRDRILTVIDDFDYQPNMNARGLVKGKTNLLSLITPPDADFFGTYYFRKIVQGISNALSSNHYRLMIYQPENRDSSNDLQFNSFQTDGTIFIAPSLDDRLVKNMEVRNKPAVIISGRSPDINWVDLDNMNASIEVIEKLVQKGHRQIGFIDGSCRYDRNSIDRFDGYRSVLDKYKISFDSHLVAKGNHKMKGGYEAAKQLLKCSPRPTALFAINDDMAIGAMSAINESGLSIPDDISIFGFDDTETASLMTPALSTVRQPFFEMGRIGCEMLISRIENPKMPQKTMELKGEVILRGSISQVRSSGR